MLLHKICHKSAYNIDTFWHIDQIELKPSSFTEQTTLY